jgi:hypothetical protein
MEETPVVMPVTALGLGRRHECKVVGNDEGWVPGLVDARLIVTRLLSILFHFYFSNRKLGSGLDFVIHDSP